MYHKGETPLELGEGGSGCCRCLKSVSSSTWWDGKVPPSPLPPAPATPQPITTEEEVAARGDSWLAGQLHGCRMAGNRAVPPRPLHTLTSPSCTPSAESSRRDSWSVVGGGVCVRASSGVGVAATDDITAKPFFRPLFFALLEWWVLLGSLGGRGL